MDLYQIYYDDATRQAIDPAFIPLDNSDNLRPDWREYWPIRRVLTGAPIDPERRYAFLSPKFGAKTLLSGDRVLAFASRYASDVLVFSPFVEQSSIFLNVFEHGEAHHPGLLAAMQAFVNEVGLKVDLERVVCDHASSVFSNFFIARGRFWQRWLALGEQLYALCESGEGPVAQMMNARARYHASAGEVAMKVFVMERLASLLLVSGEFSVRAYDPFAMRRPGRPEFYRDSDMRIANGLKMGFRLTGDSGYLDTFFDHREKMLERRAQMIERATGLLAAAKAS